MIFLSFIWWEISFERVHLRWPKHTAYHTCWNAFHFFHRLFRVSIRGEKCMRKSHPLLKFGWDFKKLSENKIYFYLKKKRGKEGVSKKFTVFFFFPYKYSIQDNLTNYTSVRKTIRVNYFSAAEVNVACGKTCYEIEFSKFSEQFIKILL